MSRKIMPVLIGLCSVLMSQATAAPPAGVAGSIGTPKTIAPNRPVAALQLTMNTPFVESVNSSGRCSANNQSTDVTLTANLVMPRAALGGTNKPLIYVWIDDVAAPPIVGTVYEAPGTIDAPKSGVSVSLEKSFAGLGGKARVQFSLGLNGTRSSVQEVEYSCVSLVSAGPRPELGTLTLPNFKVLPLVAVVYDPPVRLPDPNAPPRVCQTLAICETRVSLGRAAVALIETDLSRTFPVYRVLYNKCPSNGDAFLTLKFAIAIEAKATNIDGYVGESYFESTYPFHGSPVLVQGGRVLDTRHRPRYRSISNLPDGYEWAFFDRVVKCATDTVIEYKIDPENKLSESDETDNVIRFRISTITP